MASILKNFFVLSDDSPVVPINQETGFIQPSFQFYNIISKVLQNHDSSKDTSLVSSLPPSSFTSINFNTELSVSNHYVKYVFHNQAILSDFIADVSVRFTSSRLDSVNDPVARLVPQDIVTGIVSVGASSSLLYTDSSNNLFPLVPFTFFGARIGFSSGSFSLTPFIEQSFCAVKQTENPLYFVDKFSSTHVYYSQEGSPSTVLSSPSHVLFRKNDLIQFLLRKEIYLENSVHRTRYILTVKNNSIFANNSATVVFKVPIVQTRREALSFYSSLPTSGPLDSDTFLVSSYADRLGWFEICKTIDSSSNDNTSENPEQSQELVSLDPLVSRFKVSVSAPTSSGNVAISDSVGLGYGISEYDELGSSAQGMSFLSEYKRINDNNLIILSAQFLSFEDLNSLLKRNIDLLVPKTLILFLGLDTVGRRYFSHSSMVVSDSTNQNLKKFNVLNYTLLPVTSTTTDVQSITNNFKTLFNDFISQFSSDKLVVGFPPVLVSSMQNSLFFSSDIPSVSLPNVLLNYSNELSQMSSAFDYYISLRDELGNATSYNSIYQVKLTSGLNPELSALYFNSRGHDLLRNLLLRVLRSSVTTMSSLMNQKQLDVRIGITKFFNNQKVYSVQDNHNYLVKYDAKLDVLLKVSNTDAYEEVKLGGADVYDFLVVVPYFGSAVLKLEYVDSTAGELMLIPNRPTILFVSFKKIFLKNNSLREIPVTIILGKTN